MLLYSTDFLPRLFWSTPRGRTHLSASWAIAWKPFCTAKGDSSLKGLSSLADVGTTNLGQLSSVKKSSLAELESKSSSGLVRLTFRRCPLTFHALRLALFFFVPHCVSDDVQPNIDVRHRPFAEVRGNPWKLSKDCGLHLGSYTCPILARHSLARHWPDTALRSVPSMLSWGGL